MTREKSFSRKEDHERLVGAGRRVCLQPLEQQVHRAWEDTRVFLGPADGVSLARPSASIGENGRGKPLAFVRVM